MNTHVVYGIATLTSSKNSPSFSEGFKLDNIPVDFLLPNELGHALMSYFGSIDQGWQRISTSSEAQIIDGLLDLCADPTSKIVSTYASESRTLLQTDGLSIVVSTTCHIASAPVVMQLLAMAKNEARFSILRDWTNRHQHFLSCSGGLGITAICTKTICHIAEVKIFRPSGFRYFLGANS
jgi:hypothetical protein